MKIAVVIAVYIENTDHLYFLKSTLASLKSQHDLRVYIVENYVNPIIRTKLDEVEIGTTVVQNSENIVSMAWNKGIVQALADGASYVLVPNADVILKSNCIDNLVAFAQAHPEHEMVTASEYVDLRTLEIENEDDGVADSPHFSCFLVRPSFIKNTGGFDENLKPAYREDQDLHYRMRLLGLSAVSIGKARFYHYGSRTIHTSNEPRVAEMKLGSGNTEAYYLRKWGGLAGHEIFKTPFNLGGSVKKW